MAPLRSTAPQLTADAAPAVDGAAAGAGADAVVMLPEVPAGLAAVTGEPLGVATGDATEVVPGVAVGAVLGATAGPVTGTLTNTLT